MALNEQIATNVGPSGIEIAYERRGNPTDPLVLLIMGGAAQLVHWPEGFLAALLRRGLQVIRFDNRDAGRSTHFHEGPTPDVRAALAGDFSSAAYTLSDMAADTVGLLDALELDAAHVVGASLGGAIAQTIAIEHPARILSLTSMMSTTGDMTVGQVHLETLTSVFGGPPAATRQEVIDRAVLVIHGVVDPMCDVSGGRATAAAIPGAELVLINGMGHHLPPGLWERFADHIAEVVERGERKRR